MMLSAIYFVIAALCFGYYLLLGFSVRFGQSLSLIWIAAGALFAAAGLISRYCHVPAWLRIAWHICVIGALAAVLIPMVSIFSGLNAVLEPDLDYVIVLGARVDGQGRPSAALVSRMDTAAEYLKKNPDTVAVASGGKGEDEAMSEAECIRIGLTERGIAPDRIMLEDRSTDTRENLIYSSEITGLEAKVGIVTSGYHVYRACRMAEKAGFTHVSGGSSGVSLVTAPHYILRESCALLFGFVFGD